MAAETCAASEVYLVSDHRERYVHGALDAVAATYGVAHIKAQLTVGDYLVCRRTGGEPPEILAVIERKTLADFSASFKDNRYENRNKMLDLRNRTGSQLYFFVEGPAFPDPKWKVARIPYANILAAMTGLMIRDGIHIVQTKDVQHTAQRLVDFARTFERTPIAYTYPVVEEPAEHQAVPGSVPELAIAKIDKSDGRLVVEIWARLPGVSVAIAGVLSRSFSVAALVAGGVSDGELAALRTPANRALPKKALASLRAARTGWTRETEKKLLSGVPGVSPAMAADILAARKLSGLLEGGAAACADITIAQKGRQVRLGGLRAGRVCRLLAHVEPAPAVQAGRPACTSEKGAPEKCGSPAGSLLDDDCLRELLETYGAE